jgi:hypothetical protein
VGCISLPSSSALRTTFTTRTRVQTRRRNSAASAMVGSRTRRTVARRERSSSNGHQASGVWPPFPIGPILNDGCATQKRKSKTTDENVRAIGAVPSYPPFANTRRNGGAPPQGLCRKPGNVLAVPGSYSRAKVEITTRLIKFSVPVPERFLCRCIPATVDHGAC